MSIYIDFGMHTSVHLLNITHNHMNPRFTFDGSHIYMHTRICVY